jgi:hypothetical protein
VAEGGALWTGLLEESDRSTRNHPGKLSEKNPGGIMIEHAGGKGLSELSHKALF